MEQGSSQFALTFLPALEHGLIGQIQVLRHKRDVHPAPSVAVSIDHSCSCWLLGTKSLRADDGEEKIQMHFKALRGKYLRLRKSGPE